MVKLVACSFTELHVAGSNPGGSARVSGKYYYDVVVVVIVVIAVPVDCRSRKVIRHVKNVTTFSR